MIMKLTKKQFNVLVYLEAEGKSKSQRDIAAATDLSVGTVNRLMTEMTELGYVSGGAITTIGVEALEPYRVKRAVFMAAGFGSRMVPITLNTPKPLVRVKGKRIIDSLLDAVVSVGIKEIYLVRGYLSDQFDQLLKKYPDIIFIENPVYNETNNISSAFCARHLMANSYVFESDLLLYNPTLITKYQYESNYLGVPTNVTEDWCFETDNAGYIKRLMQGGTNCYHSVSPIGRRRTALASAPISSASIDSPAAKNATGIRSFSIIASTAIKSPSAPVPSRTSSRLIPSTNSKNWIPITQCKIFTRSPVIR